MMKTKLYFHMTYNGTQGRSFTTKAAAIRSAALFMRTIESEREFLMVVCRELGLPGRDGRPKDIGR
jgi:hypothetical protein